MTYNCCININDLCQYIIQYETANNRIVTNRRLGLFLYFIQVEFLLHFGYPCFEEDIKATSMGPLVPEIRRRYFAFGNNPITVNGKTCLDMLIYDKRYQERVNTMLENAKAYSDFELEDISKRQEPWKHATKTPSNIIEHQAIIDYFKNK